MATASELNGRCTDLQAYDESGRPRSVTARLTHTNGCECVAIGDTHVELHAVREALCGNPYRLVRLGPGCCVREAALRAAVVRLGVRL